jgi:hypothetical protein
MRLRLYYVSKKKYTLMPSLRSPFKVLLNVIKREGAISIRSGRRRRVQFVQSSFLTKGAVQFLLCFRPCQHIVTGLQLQTS